MVTRKTRHIAGAHTLELARYEVGNAITKENRIFKTLTQSEAEELTREAGRLLANMEVHSVEGGEDAVTRTAIEFGLSYYDSAYIYTAAVLGLTLATEDKRLTRTAKEKGIPTTTLDDLA